MKAKEIQELLDFIASSGLAEVNIETEHFKLSVKKHQELQPRYVEAPALQIAPSQQLAVAPVVTPVTPPAISTNTPSVSSTPDASAKNYITIKSPMIGTFYRSSNPETPSFVNIGDEVKVGQTVCIIEAMKLFNEIESEISGKIVKVLVENASPVEYDQPLFLVEPA